MNIEEIELHDTLQQIITIAPILKQCFSQDVSITISDKEKVIKHISSIALAHEAEIGRTLDPDEPLSRVMRTNKAETVLLPEEKFGISLKITTVPIIDEIENSVIGSIAVSHIDHQTKLMKVAEQFAASSEEISASTQELSSSSIDFNHYLHNLADAQADITKQVDNTAKILEMINSVAKNTRILGFNAGIEAARSGEYGRGFSVVAKEITKLADQSAESVKEIRQLLDELKEKVQQVATVIKDSVTISNNQSQSIEEISQNIQYLTDVAEDIEELAKKI